MFNDDNNIMYYYKTVLYDVRIIYFNKI